MAWIEVSNAWGKKLNKKVWNINWIKKTFLTPEKKKE